MRTWIVLIVALIAGSVETPAAEPILRLGDRLAICGDSIIKVGSICQSERLAKYNRLLEIEAKTGWPVIGWPGLASHESVPPR